MIADFFITNAKRTFMQTRLRLIFCLFLVAAAALTTAGSVRQREWTKIITPSDLTKTYVLVFSGVIVQRDHDAT